MSSKLCIVDIGDSAGTHVKKIRKLLEHEGCIEGAAVDTVSVNLDPAAVEKIKKNGEHAVLCRAEDYKADRRVDLYLSYEMCEHLHNPSLFFHRIAKAGNGNYMVITVPYVSKSRVALRSSMRGIKEIPSEIEHIFELCPQDWKKIMIHSGWKVLEQKIYRQYPSRIPLYSNLLRLIWRKYDFEGFVGFILKRDMTVADRYLDWEDE